MPHSSMSHSITRHLFAMASFFVLASTSLQGQTYTEIGDAGQTLGGAQGTGPVNGVALTTISRNITGINDADLFVFQITAATTFSATTS